MITIEIAKDGSPVPLWDGYQLHSLYDPIKEGKTFTDDFCSTIGDFTTPLLVFGLGFGYHILPLLDKFEDIYIIESNHELITKAKENSFLKTLFEKCKLIDNYSKIPNITNFNQFTLRSEIRFQENFFEEIQAKAKLQNTEYIPSFNKLRVLVNMPVYGGSYSIGKYVETALNALNVSVQISDHSVAEPILKKLISNEKANAALLEQLIDFLSDILLNDIQEFNPHIVFFLAQSPFNEKIIKILQKENIITMYWFVEDFRRLVYWKRVYNNFDYFFMIQKGEFEDILQQSCHRTWGWFPVASESTIMKPLNLTHQEKEFYGSNISFMGAAYPNRVAFFSHFKKEYLKLWGTGWTESVLKDYNIPLYDQRISIEQSVMIYQATKVNINLHSSMNEAIFDYYQDFVNPRTFEIASCGGFQLVDDREAVRELFEEDKEIVFFKSIEEAIDKADFYIKNDKLRNEIANNSREKVLLHHTYKHRLTNMINIALKHSTKLSARIYEESQKLSAFLMKTQDKDLEIFLDKFKPADSFNYNKIIGEMNNSNQPLKRYEAMLMLLDSFYKGE